MRITITKNQINTFVRYLEKFGPSLVILILINVSVISFLHFYNNQLGIAYNDARSHLDIGRRVVEGLKPGAAQLGSVWLPLTHFLMAITVWNDFMWHSGLAGAIQSMIAFVLTGLLIYKFLEKLDVGLLGRITAVLIFTLNINILYLQSTAMTELMLIFTMTAGAYFFMLWHKDDNVVNLIICAFFIMLSTLVRYDGWYLLFMAFFMIFFRKLIKKDWREAEGTAVMFGTLAGFGVFLWLLWNLLIFGDPLYFAFGPYSAHSQQLQLESAGVLATKHNLLLSAKIYIYALAYNSTAYIMILGTIGALVLAFHKSLKPAVRYGSMILFAPLLFNILALYLGHSVLFIQGLSGNTWFNVRYGVMMMPSFAIFIGYLVERAKNVRPVILGMTAFVIFFALANADAVTIDDALVGSSQKNVTEVSGWLRKNVTDEKGYILISAASHDSVIFTSGLPMKRFIHEGTGKYYELAIEEPDRWARWIVVRSYSEEDSTWRLLKDNLHFTDRYKLVDHYPFADIYELESYYLPYLNTDVILKQK